MALPVTRYAKSGDVHIAYQVFGSGPIDLVFVPGFVSHIEAYWDHPDLARWLLRLASFARVATFDKRGTGHDTKWPDACGEPDQTGPTTGPLGRGTVRC
jgi:pimeloyl-ACP methyl ester carboxylesterase